MQRKKSKLWTPETRLLTALNHLADARTHVSLLARETPHVEQNAMKALLLIEQAEQVLGRDATRDLSLPSYRYAGLLENLDAFVDKYPYHESLELLADKDSVKIGRGAFEISEPKAVELVGLGLAKFSDVAITLHGTREYLRGERNPTGVPYLQYLEKMADEISVGIGQKSSQIPERIAAEMVELDLAKFTEVAITLAGRNEFLKGEKAFEAV